MVCDNSSELNTRPTLKDVEDKLNILTKKVCILERIVNRLEMKEEI